MYKKKVQNFTMSFYDMFLNLLFYTNVIQI